MHGYHPLSIPTRPMNTQMIRHKRAAWRLPHFAAPSRGRPGHPKLPRRNQCCRRNRSPGPATGCASHLAEFRRPNVHRPLASEPGCSYLLDDSGRSVSSSGWIDPHDFHPRRGYIWRCISWRRCGVAAWFSSVTEFPELGQQSGYFTRVSVPAAVAIQRTS